MDYRGGGFYRTMIEVANEGKTLRDKCPSGTITATGMAEATEDDND